MTQRVPVLGDNVPQSGNAFTRALGRSVLALFGWRVEGELPNCSKFIIVGAPHTSNMDGVLGLAALLGMGLRANTMIKASLFVGPLGVLLRALGAIPIDRDSPKGIVEQSAEAFAERDQLVLLITPEGTRKAAKEFKKGFHRIAKAADVPIVPAAANYEKRSAILGAAMTAGDDYDADLQRLVTYYRENGSPKHAERLSHPLRAAAE